MKNNPSLRIGFILSCVLIGMYTAISDTPVLTFIWVTISCSVVLAGIWFFSRRKQQNS